MSDEDDAWFAPKCYGYGAGQPVARQGWLLLAGYSALAIGCGLLVQWDHKIGGLAAAAIMVPATVGLIAISKARTRGGWRWRWGDEN